MIDLSRGLGAPPIVFPGVRMFHPEAPSGLPGNAPVMPIGQAAQRALGNSEVSTAAPQSVADLRPWFSRLPLWAKIGMGIGAAGVLAGVSYGVYRAVR